MLVAACLIAIDWPEVALRSIDGKTASGTLVEWDAERIVLQGASGRAIWELARVAEIRFGSSGDAKVSAPISVELTDGSTIAGTAFSMERGQARIKLVSEEDLAVDGSAIRFVRFASQGAGPSAPWDRIAAAAKTNDVLVVRNANAVDYHQGILRRVSDESVVFELEGERITVRRSKVFGLACHQPPGRELPPAIGSLTDRFGCTWSMRSATLARDQVEWVTPSGVGMKRLSSDLLLMRLTSSGAVYLSDLEADSIKWTPYFAMSREIESRKAFFAPRRDQNLQGGPLQLSGEQYAKGLCIPSRTEMAFRLPDRFRRFAAVVGIDDSVRPLGHVRLVIRGDDRTLLETTVSGGDPPKPLELDIAGVRRLDLLVDFGDDLDVGDVLDLCEARLLK